MVDKIVFLIKSNVFGKSMKKHLLTWGNYIVRVYDKKHFIEKIKKFLSEDLFLEIQFKLQ